jgi:hypothetical protein
MQHLLNDFSTLISTLFYEAAGGPAWFEAHALLISPRGVSGKFSDGNKALYSFLRLPLNGLLTETSSG